VILSIYLRLNQLIYDRFSDSPLQPMCVSDDGKLITMTEKFHNMQTEEESSSDES